MRRDFVQLRIEDDGRGFIAEDDVAGFGIRSMRKRAADIAGSLAIRSSPGTGTEILIRCRLKTPKPTMARKPVSAEQLWRQIRHVVSTGRPDSNPHRG